MYTTEFRNACIRLHAHLKSYRKVASLIGGSASSICRWSKRKDCCTIRKKRVSKIDKPVVIEAIQCALSSNPFLTTKELRPRIESVIGTKISLELARVAVRKAGMTLKTPRFYAKPNHLEATTIAFQAKKDAVKHFPFVSIDETGFSSNIRNNKGYAPVGKRLHVRYKPSSKQKKHISVVAAIDEEGALIYNKLEGHYTKLSYLDFLKTLPYPKQTVILMDNVSFHHSKEVLEYIGSREWVPLHTPPYSPWFNPIERVFSLVKSAYRKNPDIDNAFLTVKPHHVRNIMASRCLE